MNDNRKRVRYALLALVLLVSGASAAMAASGVKAGQAAPDFTGEKLKGGSLQLSQLRGKVVLVDFWASWCKPCAEALPVFSAFNEKYADKGLVIVGVNIDDEKQNAVDFLKKIPVSFSVVHDANKKIVGTYGPPTMPSSYLLDREGKVHSVHAGFRSADAKKIEAELQALLK